MVDLNDMLVFARVVRVPALALPPTALGCRVPM